MAQEGSWVAKLDGRELARGNTAMEAYKAAIAAGARPDKVVLEYDYTTPRVF